MKTTLGTMVAVMVVAILAAASTMANDAIAGEIDRDGRFIAYDNGTVLDTKTKLMWAAKDNGYDIDWANAEYYCENYRAGGYTEWRLPTLDELESLYDEIKTYESDCGYDVHLTDFIHLTALSAWASNTYAMTPGPAAASFRFYDGTRYWYYQWGKGATRVLPVRTSDK